MLRGAPSPGPLGAAGALAARRACHLTLPTRGYRPVPPTPALRCSTDMKLDASWYSDKEWRGFVLHDARRDLLERHVFVTWVAGISHYPAAVDLPDFEPGSEVVLRPEPDNPFDPKAIGWQLVVSCWKQSSLDGPDLGRAHAGTVGVPSVSDWSRSSSCTAVGSCSNHTIRSGDSSQFATSRSAI